MDIENELDGACEDFLRRKREEFAKRTKLICVSPKDVWPKVEERVSWESKDIRRQMEPIEESVNNACSIAKAIDMQHGAPWTEGELSLITDGFLKGSVYGKGVIKSVWNEHYTDSRHKMFITQPTPKFIPDILTLTVEEHISMPELLQGRNYSEEEKEEIRQKRRKLRKQRKELFFKLHSMFPDMLTNMELDITIATKNDIQHAALSVVEDPSSEEYPLFCNYLCRLCSLPQLDENESFAGVKFNALCRHMEKEYPNLFRWKYPNSKTFRTFLYDNGKSKFEVEIEVYVSEHIPSVFRVLVISPERTDPGTTFFYHFHESTDDIAEETFKRAFKVDITSLKPEVIEQPESISALENNAFVNECDL